MKHYIQWETSHNHSLEAQISEAIKHWQHRFELGTALLLVDEPTSALKTATKQWRKVTRQIQNARNEKTSANDILELTRTISRMQRMKFTTKTPDSEPTANFYILNKNQLESLPLHCYTLYYAQELPATTTLKLLPANSLIVAFEKKHELKGFYAKSTLEESVQTAEAELLGWLESQSISISALEDNLEKANEALDLLLSSANLQAEFSAKSSTFIQSLRLAQPIKLSVAQQKRLENVERLVHHVRVLSPAFLSDHIVDSQNDDSFLLRDPATGAALTLELLTKFISAQYQAGRTHLATALEQKAGFIRI